MFSYNISEPSRKPERCIIEGCLTIFSYLYRHGKKSVPFGHKWRISAPGIVINNPKIINFFNYKFHVGPHKGGLGRVNYNLRRTYCPPVPKQKNFSAKGSPQYIFHSVL